MDPNAETPAQGGGIGAAGAMGMATQGLNFVSAFTPQDNNDGIGMSHKASKITSGISTGLDTASQMAGSFNPIAGAAIGGVSALFKMIKGAVDHKRENDRSITSRLARKEYDPTQDNVGYSFGTRATPSATPVFGGQADAIAKYGMPLYGNGGKPIYTSDPSDKRLQAYNDSSALYKKTQDINNPKYYENGNPSWYTWKGTREEAEAFSIKNNIDYKYTGEFPGKIKPISTQDWGEGMNAPIYKKPVQPVILKPVPRAGNINIRSESLEGFKNGGGIPSFASVDNTKTKLTPPQELTVKQLSDIQGQQQIQKQLDQKILLDRKARIETSNKYNKTPLSKTTKETISKSLEGTPDKFRIFPNDPHSFVDDYLNPGVMIGSMAKNLAQSKSAKDYALSIGTPLTVGALAGLSTKNTGQFINNITNPLAGIKNPFEDIIRPKNPALTAGQQEWLSQHETIKKVLDKNPNANVKKGLEDLKNNTSNFPNKESIDLRKSDDYIKKRKEIVGNIGYENSKLQNDKIFDFKLNEQLKNSTTASKEFIQDNIKSANNDWLRSTNEMSLVKQAFRDSYDLQKESKLLNKPFKGPLADWYKEASDIINTNHNIDALYNNKTIQFKESIDNYYNHYDPKIPSEKLLDKDFYMRKNKFGGPVFALGGEPIYTSDPNDKRLKAYNDSLSLYKIGEKLANPRNMGTPQEFDFLNSNRGQSIGTSNNSFATSLRFKEPVQPVIYKKEIKVPVPKKNFNNLKEKQNILGDNIQYQNEPVQEELKGKPLNDFLKQERKNPNGGVNTYIRKDTKSPWLQQDFALGGDPRAQSNIEAEQGEAMQHSSGKIEAIGGKKHENGGTPLQVQPSHEYIYSDSLGYDREGNMTLDENLVRYSFADNAKKIERKYKGRENDSIVQKTKKLELGKLKQDAEQARVAKEEMEMGKQMKKYKAKYGATLKKFGTSGYVPFTNFPGSIGDEAVDPNSTLAMQQQLLQYNPNALPKYGADNKWGAETTAGFVNNPGVYNLQQSTQSSTPQPLFGGGNRINPFVGPRVPSRRDNLREAANFYTPGQVGTPKPMAQAQDRQEDIAPDAVKKNGFFGDLTTGDKMQLASMLPAFGFNMGMGLRKADVEPNRKNPYENDVLSMMANRKFDIQNYLNQSNLATNTAKEDIGNNSTSVGGKMANLQKLFANQSNALGDITTKGQEMNNQYRAEEANTKNIIGEANRAESIRAAGINDQNKARKQQFLAKAFEQMGQGIATTGQSANQSLTNKLLIKSLSEISPDFDVKNMKDLQVGDDGYIVFKGVKTEFKMSDEGKIVMAGGTPNTANAAKSQYAPKSFSIGNFTNTNKSKRK